MALLYLLGINLFLAVTIFTMRFKLLPEVGTKGQLCLLQGKTFEDFKVSIHIPVKELKEDELKKTLTSISNQSCSSIEIIVACSEISSFKVKQLKRIYPNLKILRTKEKSTGRLLNKCLERTSKEAQFIFVCSQGHIIQAHTLEIAASKLETEMANYIQYPLSPQINSSNWSPCLAEHSFYFQTYARVKTSHAPFWGELVLVKKEALLKVAGWSESKTGYAYKTGVKIKNSGFSGVYDPSGHLNSRDDQTVKLAATKLDFIKGALSTLTLKDILNMELKDKTVLTLQLTPFNNFILYPLGLLIWLAMSEPNKAQSLELLHGSEFLAATTILGSMYFSLLLYLQKLGPATSTKNILKVFLTSLARAIESKLFIFLPGNEKRAVKIALHLTFTLICAAVSWKLYQFSASVSALAPVTLAVFTAFGAFLDIPMNRSNFKQQNEGLKAVAGSG